MANGVDMIQLLLQDKLDLVLQYSFITVRIYRVNTTAYIIPKNAYLLYGFEKM